MNLKSIYPIGIDIGSNNIYAAQLKKNRQDLVARGFVHRECEGVAQGIFNGGDGLIPVLRQIAKDKRFRGRRAVVHFPSQYLLSFPITFEVHGEETIEQAILRKSKDYINFPLEEAIIDYPSLTPFISADADKYRASINAVRRDHMKQYLLMLKKAGLTVEAVDSGISSLIRLHSHTYKSIQNPTILCNIGSGQSLLSVVTRDSILVQRHVPWGVQMLLKNLQANLELSQDRQKAEVLLKNYGLFFEDCLECSSSVNPGGEVVEQDMRDMYRAIYQIINPHIEELVHEFHKVIGYARSEEHGESFEGIYIYGQGTTIHHLDHYLERRLNVPAKLMNPLSKIGLSDDSILPDVSEGSRFGLALGLAMRKVTWL
ncbi:MAG: pilus assembly protein PilM [Deltaproteobacteria bacterium]|nr:pilus assembly protein PilM [Deltaproteobacteria bacterium]